MMTLFLTFDTEEERDAFTDYYESYAGMMFHVANAILHNEADAEDIVHDTFLTIADNLQKIHVSDRKKLGSLFAIMTEHKAIDFLRRRKKLLFPGDEVLEGFPSANDPLFSESDIAAVLAGLPIQERKVVLLRFGYGYSAREIAGLLGRTPSSISSLLHRAKKRMEEELSGKGAKHE